MSTLPKSMLVGLSLILLVLVLTPNSKAQMVLDGEQLCNPTVPELTDIGQRTVIYKPQILQGNSDPAAVLFFTPFFVFENNKDGSLKVDVFEPSAENRPWQVRLTLLVSPDDLLSRIAASVRAAAATSLPLKPYQFLLPQNLVPVEFTSISIAEANGNGDPVSTPLFASFTSNTITAGQPLELFADCKTEAQARDLALKLREKKALAHFRVDYRLFATMTVSQASVDVHSISIKNTDGVQTLSGAGRAFKVSVDPANGLAEIGNNDIISRDQQMSFDAQVRNQIRADYKFEREEDRQFLMDQLNTFMGEATTQANINLEDVGKAMNQLSAYSFSPSDLSPDKIQNLAIEAKNAMQTEDQSKFSFAGSASASFCGFGGSASAGFSRDDLKKQMTDKGWTFGDGGEKYVPKSLKVYVVNKNALESVKDIDLNVKQVQRTQPLIHAFVSSDRGFAPGQDMVTLKSDDLEAMKAQIDTLTNDDDQSTKEMVGTWDIYFAQYSRHDTVKFSQDGTFLMQKCTDTNRMVNPLHGTYTVKNGLLRIEGGEDTYGAASYVLDKGGDHFAGVNANGTTIAAARTRAGDN